ncbi:hypothetical protein TNCV_1282291 [Trichonephila clavipes]|uniref:Uncharacterized protein n=1 Tax=Trichonephila clavipes TaxID=2585209 RepID=A0A8X6SLD2_TRICX|nr:hypothetical protein TNCV_1282291 [Trichonephila clavipes]
MTTESNQAIEMTYGTEILTDGNGTENMTEPNPTGNDMDQSLPPSRPGTPQLSTASRVKSTAVKRKETDIGFVSPPTRKLSKNLRTNANPINLSNKFNGLENQEPSSNPVAGTLTGNPSATNTTKNSTTIVSDNDKKLPQ